MPYSRMSLAEAQRAAERDSDFAFVSWLCALISAGCAAVFVFARVGLEGSSVFPLLCVSVLWAAAFSVFLFPDEWRVTARGRAATSLAALMLLAGPLAAYWLPPLLFTIYAVLAIVGTIRAWYRFRPTPLQIFALVVLPPLTSLYIVTTLQSLQNGAHLFAPEFAKLGWLTSSAYYHSTIAYLAQVHGAITAGLDGLDFRQRYHPGSHVWFGGLAAAGGSTPMFAYPLGYLVIVLPGLLLAGGGLIVGASVGAASWVRVLALMALVLVVERLNFPSFYSSESYGVSLLALTFAVPLLFVLRPRDRDAWSAAYLPWLVAVVLVVPLTITKVSTGAVWAALVGFRAVQVWGLRTPAFLVAFLLAAVIVHPLSISLLEWGRLFDSFRGVVTDTTNAVPLEMFRFFREQPLTTLSALVPASMLFALRPTPGVQEDRAGGTSACTTKPYLDILLVMSLVGLLATGLYVGGDDSWYFLAPVQWIGLLFLAALADAARVSGLWNSVLGFNGQRLFLAGVVGMGSLALMLMVALRIEFNINSTMHSVRSMITVLKPDAPLGHAMDRDVMRAWVRNSVDSNVFDGAFVKALSNSPGGKVTRIADTLLGANRVGAAAFIAPSQHAAWEKRFELLPGPGTMAPLLPRVCAEQFFVQALIGVPLLQGVPPFWSRCPGSHQPPWGHASIWRRLITTDLDDMAICAIARPKKIGRVLVLGGLDIPERNRLLVCHSNESAAQPFTKSVLPSEKRTP